jgi:hypothetical protein
MYDDRLRPRRGDATNKNEASSNTDAVVTRTAPGEGLVWCIGGIYWSYSANPTNGGVRLTDGATEILEQHVAGAGFQQLTFNPPMKITQNSALEVRVLAGGVLTAKLYVHCWVERDLAQSS